MQQGRMLMWESRETTIHAEGGALRRSACAKASLFRIEQAWIESCHQNCQPGNLALSVRAADRPNFPSTEFRSNGSFVGETFCLFAAGVPFILSVTVIATFSIFGTRMNSSRTAKCSKQTVADNIEPYWQLYEAESWCFAPFREVHYDYVRSTSIIVLLGRLKSEGDLCCRRFGRRSGFRRSYFGYVLFAFVFNSIWFYWYL